MASLGSRAERQILQRQVPKAPRARAAGFKRLRPRLKLEKHSNAPVPAKEIPRSNLQFYPALNLGIQRGTERRYSSYDSPNCRRSVGSS